jgi:hypothetical protein
MEFFEAFASEAEARKEPLIEVVVHNGGGVV